MIKLTQEIIQSITLFENVTGADVKDCIPIADGLLFIVEEGNVQKALRQLPKLERLFHKKISLLAYSPDLVKFVQNLLYPIKAKEITVEGNVVSVVLFDEKDKGKIYGRGRENLRWMLSVLQKYFPIAEIRVL
ncbi:NusA-like transcription termination signal-binding factor [Candidatus Woesearchaeota archaeon]|nr:NusA-like transcription termination signal-binding factor [Candidatus Woesearchaeota archaeon]